MSEVHKLSIWSGYDYASKNFNKRVVLKYISYTSCRNDVAKVYAIKDGDILRLGDLVGSPSSNGRDEFLNVDIDGILFSSGGADWDIEILVEPLVDLQPKINPSHVGEFNACIDNRNIRYNPGFEFGHYISPKIETGIVLAPSVMECSCGNNSFKIKSCYLGVGWSTQTCSRCGKEYKIKRMGSNKYEIETRDIQKKIVEWGWIK